MRGDMKTCSKCKTAKDLDQFYAKQTYCKDCCKAQQKAWAEKNWDRRLEINRQWTLRNHDRKLTMNWATNRLNAAIRRGEMVRPDMCQQCGQAGKIEASHSDYSKPLQVDWLCQPCHRTFNAAHPMS